MLITVQKDRTVAANFYKNVFKDPRHPGTSIFFMVVRHNMASLNHCETIYKELFLGVIFKSNTCNILIS